jgi:hypothetical protein
MVMIGLVLLLSSCASPSPAPKSAQVRGKLIDASSGQPVKNAILQLWKVTGVKDGIEIASGEYPVSEVKADDRGAFLFTNVPPQRYLLFGIYEEESDYIPLRLMGYNGLGQKPAIEVTDGQDVDLGIVQNCRHTICGPEPTME